MPEIAMTYFGRPAFLSCDGKCNAAWGLNWHGKKIFPAPIDPETYEGGHAKPTDGIFNKWCARECERSNITEVI